MKRILGLLLFILSVPCFAADNIKMVTYFPVPYLAYNELGVVGTCDLGLMGTCGLDAGKYLSVRPNAGVAQSGLNRGVLALKGSELDLQSTALAPHVQSYVLRVGNHPTSKAQEAPPLGSGFFARGFAEHRGRQHGLYGQPDPVRIYLSYLYPQQP